MDVRRTRMEPVPELPTASRSDSLCTIIKLATRSPRESISVGKRVERWWTCPLVCG